MSPSKSLQTDPRDRAERLRHEEAESSEYYRARAAELKRYVSRVAEAALMVSTRIAVLVNLESRTEVTRYA